jgi:hypothetical protein
MENLEIKLQNDELFDPDKAFNQMLELNNKASELVHSKRAYDHKKLKKIVKEIMKLAKLRKDYFEAHSLI